MHIDAFIYDFQLRQAQQFLSGRNMLFYPGYPVQKLFERMIQIFPTPPKFACCYLAEGTESVPLYRIWHCVIAAVPNHRSAVKFSSNDRSAMIKRLETPTFLSVMPLVGSSTYSRVFGPFIQCREIVTV